MSEQLKNISPDNPLKINLSLSNTLSSPQKQIKLPDISLEKRLNSMLSRDFFLSVFKNTRQNCLKEIYQTKKKTLEQLKKTSPETFQEIDEHSTDLTEDEIIEGTRKAADRFMAVCFSENEMIDASRRLLDPTKKSILKTDYDMLKIAITIREEDVEGMDMCFGPNKGIFQGLLVKGATELTNVIGKILQKEPRTVLKYGLCSLTDPKGLDQRELSKRVDTWTSNWLDPNLIKLLIDAKTLKPALSGVEKNLKKKEEEKARRYQNDFKRNLLYYLDRSSIYSTHVFYKIIPYLDRTETDVQEVIWRLLFQKLAQNNNLQPNIVSAISHFLEGSPSKEASEIFYRAFIKNVSPKNRAEILAQFNPKTLKRYWKSFNHMKSFLHAKIKTETGEEYLRWYLFNRREISSKEMIPFLKKLDLEKDKNFIFAPEKLMDKELFIGMADALSCSKHYFWRWIKSFEQKNYFKERLAEIYSFFPDKIKRNPLYVKALNNHFDLVRQCALSGDTASLSVLKESLGKDIFWSCLKKSEGDQISGLFSLCKQGKRGLLKLVSDFPKPQQKALFSAPNDKGEKALDFCSGNFLRMVEENIFQHQYVKESLPQPEEEKKTLEQPVTEKPVIEVNTEKAKYPRQVFRLPYFDNNLLRLKTNKKLLQEVEDVIQDFKTMSGAKIQAELRKVWKKHGTLEKASCPVKDIRGGSYRLGYLVCGDADKNQGKVAFLFFWTRDQYNTLINKQGQQLVKQACTLMDKETPSIPHNPGNTGR